MENEKQDIRNYDALENAIDPNTQTDELKEIADLDLWMKSLPLKKVGKNFTSTVIASAILAQKRHTNFKLLIWAITILVMLTIGSYWLLGVTMQDIKEISYISEGVDIFSRSIFNLIEIFSSTKTRQLFLMIEGILFLVVAEKVVSSFQIIKKEVESAV